MAGNEKEALMSCRTCDLAPLGQKTARPTPAEMGIHIKKTRPGIPWGAIIIGAAIGWGAVTVARKRSK